MEFLFPKQLYQWQFLPWHLTCSPNHRGQILHMILNHLPQPIIHEETPSNTFPAALCLAGRKASCLPNAPKLGTWLGLIDGCAQPTICSIASAFWLKNQSLLIIPLEINFTTKSLLLASTLSMSNSIKETLLAAPFTEDWKKGVNMFREKLYWTILVSNPSVHMPVGHQLEKAACNALSTWQRAAYVLLSILKCILASAWKIRTKRCYDTTALTKIKGTQQQRI